MGYGSRALKALNSFYTGEYFNLDEAPQEEDYQTFEEAAAFAKVYFERFMLSPMLTVTLAPVKFSS